MHLDTADLTSWSAESLFGHMFVALELLMFAETTAPDRPPGGWSQPVARTPGPWASSTPDFF